MPDPVVTYPLDPTGLLASNKIVNERQILTAVNDRHYHFIVPRYAPFFSDRVTLTITTNGQVRTLVHGVDYIEAYPFIGASRATAKPVYGAFSFLNLMLEGVVSMTYQTIGGEWVLDTDKLLQIASETVYNPRTATWEQVTNLPNNFPPVPHAWDLVDMVGEKEVVDALKGIEDALIAQAGSDVTRHIQNFSNPHRVTKSTIGLDLVENLGMAGILEGEAIANMPDNAAPLVNIPTDKYTTLRTLLAFKKKLKTHLLSLPDPYPQYLTEVEGNEKYVKLEDGGIIEVVHSRNVNQVLEINKLYTYLSTNNLGTNAIWILPDSVSNKGKQIHFWNIDPTATLTIKSSSGVINGNYGSHNLLSINLKHDEMYSLLSDGTNWITIKNSSNLPKNTNLPVTPARGDGSKKVINSEFISRLGLGVNLSDVVETDLSNKDLNTISDSGRYRVQSNSSNKPTGVTIGVLDVVSRSTGEIYQICTSPSDIWFRVKSNNTSWGDWSRLLNNIDLNTINTGIADALAKATQAQTTATAAASQSNGSIQGVRLGALLNWWNIDNIDYTWLTPPPGYVGTRLLNERYTESWNCRPIQVLTNGTWVTISQID